jgi:hypothetical protein
MLTQIILTPWESKRLLAKAVVQLPEVQNALQKGIVSVARGITASFIMDELIPGFSKEQYCIGCIEPHRLCLVPATNRLPEIAFIDGKPQEISSAEIIKEMGPSDVFIKGANAVDCNFEAAILLGSPVGGTIGAVIGAINAKGIQFILPVGLEKLVPFSVRHAAQFTGFEKVSYAMGMAVGMFPVQGKVITEIQALEQYGVYVMPIASGGVNGAEGASILSIQGEQKDVGRTLEMVAAVKGQTPLRMPTQTCKTCDHATCPWKGTDGVSDYKAGTH